MMWTLVSDKLPTSDEDYVVDYVYRDKNKLKNSNALSRYNTILKCFEIENDYLPGCKVVKWKKKDVFR